MTRSVQRRSDPAPQGLVEAPMIAKWGLQRRTSALQAIDRAWIASLAAAFECR